MVQTFLGNRRLWLLQKTWLALGISSRGPAGDLEEFMAKNNLRHFATPWISSLKFCSVEQSHEGQIKKFNSFSDDGCG